MSMSTYFEKKKNTRIFTTKDYLRWSILILAKNASFKRFLELKHTLVFLLEIDSSQICEKSFTLTIYRHVRLKTYI